MKILKKIQCKCQFCEKEYEIDFEMEEDKEISQCKPPIEAKMCEDCMSKSSKFYIFDRETKTWSQSPK